VKEYGFVFSAVDRLIYWSVTRIIEPTNFKSGKRINMGTVSMPVVNLAEHSSRDLPSSDAM